MERGFFLIQEQPTTSTILWWRLVTSGSVRLKALIWFHGWTGHAEWTGGWRRERSQYHISKKFIELSLPIGKRSQFVVLIPSCFLGIPYLNSEVAKWICLKGFPIPSHGFSHHFDHVNSCRNLGVKSRSFRAQVDPRMSDYPLVI